jgi:hypothetical protein
LPGKNRPHWKPRINGSHDPEKWIPVFGSDHAQISAARGNETKAGGDAGFFVGWIMEVVMAGQKRVFALGDPAIHLLRKTLPKIDGYAGQARV